MIKTTKEFVAECRKRKIKVTPQRIAVFEELQKTYEHPDAEKVYTNIREYMPSISLDTVYRTLSSLESEGMVRQVGVVAGRARYDINTSYHIHFICKACKSVYDVFDEKLKSEKIPIKLCDKGDVESVNIQLLGICNKCKVKN